MYPAAHSEQSLLAMDPALGVVNPALHESHSEVDEPLTEYVPMGQESVTVLLDVEQGVVMRRPAVTGEQVNSHAFV